MRDTCLALWRLADPGNVGALIRTADAFGAVRRALGRLRRPALAEGAPRVGRARSSAFRSSRGRTRPAGGLPSSPTAASRWPTSTSTPPLTFLLGAERAGLPDELVTISHKATIALPGAAESLNVAAAGAIALYEASRRGGS